MATTRPYHHGNLRTALLERAAQTVRERGIEDLSLRELARDVGVSHAAPRRHFPDRRALLDALALAGFERLGSELREAVACAGDGFEERMRASAVAYVEFATRDAALLELMFAGKYGEQAGEFHDAAEEGFAVLREVIEQGQATGALAAGPVEPIGLVLFATLQGIAALLNGGMIEPGLRDDVVADAVARFLRGSRPAG